MNIKGKTALVTGASRGLGYALADLLARRGANLVIAARHLDELEAAKRELESHADVVAIAADVSENAEDVVAAGIKRFATIDILINNASELGPSPMPMLADLPWQAMERILRVNVTAALHLTQLVLPGMRSRGAGTIVNISSDAGANAYPGWGGYGASKAALEHMSRVLAAELDGSGIRILTIDPGDMDTQMHRDAIPDADPSELRDPADSARALLRAIATMKERYERVRLADLVPA